MHAMRKQKVFVAMSGGVDSSVAAALLKEHGFDVVGVHMRCWGARPSTSLRVQCAAERDAEDARRVAGVLQIPFYVWDFEKEYKERVVQYMIDGYKAGITPNPDVMCNREIKFGLFLTRALELGADFVATGHYVRLRNTKRYEYTKSAKSSVSYIRKTFVFRSQYSLFQAKDQNKDQSYFLWTLTQKQLQHCLFPIGDYLKPRVRQLAEKFGLPTADKKDSQGICFLGNVTIADFLKSYIPARPGLVLNTAGQKVGEHEGAAFYTIGQRHGFSAVTRNKGHVTGAHYVVQKNVKANTLTVAEGDDHPALYRKEVRLTNAHFINPQHPYKLKNVRMSVYVRVRYRQPLAKATLIYADKTQMHADPRQSAYGSASVRVLFAQPQKAVAPGQSAVFYRKTRSTGSRLKSNDFEMLGGGIIV